MDYESVIKTLGSAAIVVGALAWLAKQLVSQFLAKDIEGHKATLKANNDVALEQLKASLQIEANQWAVKFSDLHQNQAMAIKELYSRLCEVHECVARLSYQYQYRAIREEHFRKFDAESVPSWHVAPGIDNLSQDEAGLIQEMRDMTRRFYQFYRVNRIYFTPSVCNSIDRFSNLSSYLVSTYENVAIKDRDGNLIVNEKVKEVWDAALESIPELLAAIETQFRAMLGLAGRS